ncbi:Protein zer-1 [Desmophyllum pertusum]|uniref:Protein zer-1 n=1 Tax=Desmophyllum pertusum TaxID=174260 RepID=A0A9W9YZ78_9CNID|nr:Protein zer-1 [Desmophyllum pertusum]
MVVCQVHDSQKIVVGRDLHAVEEEGGVLECCWSALWNVTDETPENCELFISHGGIDLFMECKMKLGGQRDLVRNMLGLMGNVAEVPEQRSKLMSIAHVFYDLMQTESELEVTYNAAGNPQSLGL